MLACKWDLHTCDESLVCTKPLNDVYNNFVVKKILFSKLYVLNSQGGKQGKTSSTQQLMPK